MQTETLKEISRQRRILSYVLSIPFIYKLIVRKKKPSLVNRILVIQWDYFGDMILSTPSFQKLREEYPSAEIHLLANPGNEDYIDKNPYFNKIIFISNPLHLGKSKFSLSLLFNTIKVLRGYEYDLVYELTGRLVNQVFLPIIRAKYYIGQDSARNFYYLDKRIISNKKNQILRNLDVVNGESGLSLKSNKYIIWNPVLIEDRQNVSKMLLQKGVNNRYCVIHPGASQDIKKWPIDKWADLIGHIITTKGYYVILVGLTHEYGSNEEIKNMVAANDKIINLSGKLKIRELIAVMEKAELFVGTDSGPMHLAAAVNLKGVAIFGPADPERWAHYSLHRIIYKKEDCSPCPQFAFSKRCKLGETVCKGIRLITSDEVKKEIDSLLNDMNMKK